jgi:hypothetical protein
MDSPRWGTHRPTRRTALGAGAAVAVALFILRRRTDLRSPQAPASDTGSVADSSSLSSSAAAKTLGRTVVQVAPGTNCWTPTQIRLMANRRQPQDVTEVVIHWTGGGYVSSRATLRGAVSAHYLVPLAPSTAHPPVELIDPRNAAWHAGPLNRGLWEDQAHTICRSDVGCVPNGNVHSIGIECEGSTVPNAYQVDVMTDIMAGLIGAGFPLRLDRLHIVGHRDLDRQKVDPGNLDLDHVIALTRRKVSAT